MRVAALHLPPHTPGSCPHKALYCRMRHIVRAMGVILIMRCGVGYQMLELSPACNVYNLLNQAPQPSSIPPLSPSLIVAGTVTFKQGHVHDSREDLDPSPSPSLQCQSLIRPISFPLPPSLTSSIPTRRRRHRHLRKRPPQPAQGQWPRLRGLPATSHAHAPR